MTTKPDHVAKQREAAEKIKELRQAAFDEKGCGFWRAEVNKPNCCFPQCFCYPFWQPPYRHLWGVD